MQQEEGEICERRLRKRKDKNGHGEKINGKAK